MPNSRIKISRTVAVILITTCVMGCSVLAQIPNEIRQEAAGFREDWQRTFGTKNASPDPARP